MRRKGKEIYFKIWVFRASFFEVILRLSTPSIKSGFFLKKIKTSRCSFLFYLQFENCIHTANEKLLTCLNDNCSENQGPNILIKNAKELNMYLYGMIQCRSPKKSVPTTHCRFVRKPNNDPIS